jgi:hypothetical protein
MPAALVRSGGIKIPFPSLYLRWHDPDQVIRSAAGYSAALSARFPGLPSYRGCTHFMFVSEILVYRMFSGENPGDTVSPIVPKDLFLRERKACSFEEYGNLGGSLYRWSCLRISCKESLWRKEV